MTSCVELYKSLAPPSFKLKYVPTPFPPESGKENGPVGNLAVIDGKMIHCPWCQESFPDQLNELIPTRLAKAEKGALCEGTAGESKQKGGRTPPTPCSKSADEVAVRRAISSFRLAPRHQKLGRLDHEVDA